MTSLLSFSTSSYSSSFSFTHGLVSIKESMLLITLFLSYIRGDTRRFRDSPKSYVHYGNGYDHLHHRPDDVADSEYNHHILPLRLESGLLATTHRVDCLPVPDIHLDTA